MVRPEKSGFFGGASPGPFLLLVEVESGSATGAFSLSCERRLLNLCGGGVPAGGSGETGFSAGVAKVRFWGKDGVAVWGRWRNGASARIVRGANIVFLVV